jgi:hypothetical protein
MRRFPAHRLTTTVLVVFALLCSQLALAAHACARASNDDANPPMAAMDMDSGEPCAGMGMAADPQQPVLCHQHCADAPQTFDPVQLPALSIPAIVQVLVVPLLPDEADVEPGDTLAGQARPPPDPVFLSTLRLRV